MAQLSKIDSNATGLRYAEEDSLGVVSGDEVWRPLEPNSYADFGGEISTVARNPINPSRQRKKGVTVDLDASGGFNTDLTQTNLQDLLQGFFFASLRRKGEATAANATGTTDLFAVADTTGFVVGSIVLASGYAESGNNGLHIVTAVNTNVSIEVLGSTLVTETAPSDATLVVVGYEFPADDLDVVTTGDFASYVSATIDPTTLGLIPGEFIFVGGDAAGEAYAGNTVNNGFKRVRSVSATTIVVDKSDSDMVAETISGGETIRMFFGRVLKNENGTEASFPIVRRSYQLERTLGAPDDAQPTQIQAEYIEGAIPSELTLNVATADKITADLSFVGTNSSTIDAATSLKAGTRPALAEADAFNTSSDFSRVNLAVVSTSDEAPDKLFAFLQEVSLTINNNLTPNKAIGTLGSFEVTAGTFGVSGSITAYFADVAAINSVRNNSDVTLDFAIVASNAGLVFDVPLLSLGDGRPTVEQDAPITIPVSLEAATGAKVLSTLDHTLMAVFFDYLPDLADS
jgi:hypothetical protein